MPVKTVREFRVQSVPQDEYANGPMAHLDCEVTETVVSSIDVAGAENLVLIAHPDHVVLSVHGMRPAVRPVLDPAQVRAEVFDVLLSDGWDPADFQGYEGDFAYDDWLKQVVLALAGTGTCPEIDVSVLWEGSNSAPQQVCVERAGYRKFFNDSRPHESAATTSDQQLSGEDGIMAMVWRLIDYYDEMR